MLEHEDTEMPKETEKCLVDRFMNWLEKNVPKHWKIEYLDDCGFEPHVNITISLRERKE